MTGDVIIREAAPDEYDRAAALIAETFEYHRRALPDIFRHTSTPPPTREFVEDLVNEGSGGFFIAEHGDEVVGFLTVRLLAARGVAFLVSRRWAQVETLGVSEAWKGQGIGRRLMEASHVWARQRGATEMQLVVWEFNEDASAFYTALGYATAHRMMRKLIE